MFSKLATDQPIISDQFSQTNDLQKPNRFPTLHYPNILTHLTVKTCPYSRDYAYDTSTAPMLIAFTTPSTLFNTKEANAHDLMSIAIVGETPLVWALSREKPLSHPLPHLGDPQQIKSSNLS